MKNTDLKDIKAEITNLIEKNLKHYNIVGASVSIVDDCETFYSQGFGFSDKINKAKVTTDTIFKIGSITKVFTAMAIMQLREQGKIDIDKPITDYIQNFSIKSRFANARPITIRDLLCHHSGLPSDDFRNYFSSDPEEFNSVIEYLKDSYQVHPTGKLFYYSNLGVNLLGVIIERVTGLPYHQYIENVLLKELKMENSAIIPKESSVINISKPYCKGKEQKEGIMKYIPAGGIFSTANDMATYMKAIINHGESIFKNEATLNEMLIPQHPNNPMDFNMINGLGWFIGKPGLDYAGKVIWHDGGTPNFFSLTVIIPERKLGITILTNSANGAFMNHQIAIDILRLILKNKFGLSAPKELDNLSIKANHATIQNKTGKFATIAGITTIYKTGNTLKAKLTSGTVRLLPCKDGWFQLRLLIFGVIPISLKQLSKIRLGVEIVEGKKILIIEQLGFRIPQGIEYKEFNSSEHWKNLVGKYKCISEQIPRIEKFELCNSKDGLFINISSNKMGHLKLYLDIINDTEALTCGCGRFAGETIINNNNIITIFGLKFNRK
jgi:CubicO group peptidase (beta-lactamase class C family)